MLMAVKFKIRFLRASAELSKATATKKLSDMQVMSKNVKAKLANYKPLKTADKPSVFGLGSTEPIDEENDDTPKFT